ncbi:hypothetical protein [Bacillus sp. M6-12]|uniref:hypothetical protein n=1 Tax=Bacillus sp. M6-12 TaxID=2054166 RepID=UPI002155F25B|nr:hypothetical protein [Bacillus sp. M6-12]
MKKRLLFSMVTILFLLISAAGGVTASTVYYSPSLVDKTGAVAYEHTRYLSEVIGARVYGTEGEKKAKEYVKQQFARMGYESTEQPFSFKRRGQQIDSANFIAYKQGKST